MCSYWGFSATHSECQSNLVMQNIRSCTLNLLLTGFFPSSCCLLPVKQDDISVCRSVIWGRQLLRSRSPVGCSPCFHPPAVVWAELFHSPAGRWPAQSHSSYWPETPSCSGTDTDVTTQEDLTNIFPVCSDVNMLNLQTTYFDSSSRSLAPPASWSFLRCQFKSWICFLGKNKIKDGG